MGDERVPVAVEDEERRVIRGHVGDRIRPAHLLRVLLDGAADEARLGGVRRVVELGAAGGSRRASKRVGPGGVATRQPHYRSGEM
jgi:hypothetical protein